jgi:hypothetical protein
MKSPERKYKWISLLLAGVLGMSGSMDIWANEEAEIMEEGSEVVSDVLGAPQNEMVVSEDEHRPFDMEVLSGDTVSSQTYTVISENEADEQPVVSDNIISADDVRSGQFLTATTEQIINEDLIDVVLPTDISFKMVLFGEERLEGLIDSERFCVENKGYEDVCISFRGVCRGENEEDYVVNDRSVEEEIIKKKKNIWMYLRWEDQKGKILEQPGIVMGNASDPGEGEIVLKAPRRDTEGKIIGENSGSKVYFTFKGDMVSDMNEAWREGEVDLNLDYSIKTIAHVRNEDFISDGSVISELSEDDMDHGKVEVAEGLDESENIGFENEKAVSSNEGNDFSQVSENSVSNNSADVSENTVEVIDHLF